jgi:hypothetical protein
MFKFKVSILDGKTGELFTAFGTSFGTDDGGQLFWVKDVSFSREEGGGFLLGNIPAWLPLSSSGKGYTLAVQGSDFDDEGNVVAGSTRLMKAVKEKAPRKTRIKLHILTAGRPGKPGAVVEVHDEVLGVEDPRVVEDEKTGEDWDALMNSMPITAGNSTSAGKKVRK